MSLLNHLAQNGEPVKTKAKGKIVAAYVRVSTTGQNEAGQRAEIERWLTGNGIPLASVRWFVDKGKSGDNLKRPALEQLQAAAFAGEVGTIVTYKLDRLSRSLLDGINTLAGWCEKGIRVVAVSQGLDFNGTLGKMLAAILLASPRWNRKPAGSARRRGSPWRRKQASIGAAKLARRRPNPNAP
jgi:DNA invertase Pin-like site-specific DNA recombinase